MELAERYTMQELSETGVYFCKLKPRIPIQQKKKIFELVALPKK